MKVAGFGNIVQVNQLADTKGQQLFASGKTSNALPDEALISTFYPLLLVALTGGIIIFSILT
ncbi:MAG: hypothetical protein ACKO1K_11925 [Burkholderiales bacterium]